jgi:D-cysteine desulfhydrase
MSGPEPEEAPLQLFLRYPGLEARLPRVALTKRPSAAHAAEAVGENFWIKRDDQAGLVYGGNKPRKLEFILGRALAAGQDAILTFGGIGSHHALAVTLCGNRFGLQTRLVAVKQPPTPHVLETLHQILDAGAQVEIAGSTRGAASLGMRRWLAPGRGRRRPLLVLPGGSSALGCVGFVEAALEIEAQVRAGVLPEPDVIALPVGSMGTAAGLLAGLALTTLRSRILAVVVNDLLPISESRIRALANKTLRLLRRRDPEVPAVEADPARLDLPREWMGPGYGHPTPAGEHAVAFMRSAAGIVLEGTYTGKTLAAALDLRKAGSLPGTVLFWDTFNSLPLPPLERPRGDGRLSPSVRAFLESAPSA